MRIHFLSVGLLTVVFPATLVSAQNGYLADWFPRVDKTQKEQPHWVTPVATTTPRLEEEFRYDQVWTENAARVTTYNYDGGKGLELIPSEKVEVIFNLPPYLAHNNPKVKDGFGDTAFLIKYRLLAANEEHGSYILTAFLGWSVPTGSHTNGALDAIITPTIAYGKGFGHFDAQGTFGVGLPTADTSIIGRTYTWNNAFQYHLLRRWPWKSNSIPVSSRTARTTARNRPFVTPGLVLGRFHLGGRVGFTIGGGFQIAATHFHTTNHNGILSIRFPF